MNKDQIRKYIKIIRKTLNTEEISNKIVNNIRGLKECQYAENIMIYYPLKNEINLLSLLEDGKNFYLPKVHGEKLMTCPYKKGDDLKISEFKTMEPKTMPADKRCLDLVFVPALCVDKEKYRLGYGKGFYDRYLKGLNATKIVPIASCFVLDEIPHDKFDEKVSLIITENCW